MNRVIDKSDKADRMNEYKVQCFRLNLINSTKPFALVFIVYIYILDYKSTNTIKFYFCTLNRTKNAQHKPFHMDSLVTWIYCVAFLYVFFSSSSLLPIAMHLFCLTSISKSTNKHQVKFVNDFNESGFHFDVGQTARRNKIYVHINLWSG